MRTLLLFALSTLALPAQQPPATLQQPSVTPQQKPDPPKPKPPDFAGLNHYRADNEALSPPAPGTQRVVFLGDSITDFWGRGHDHGSFFPGKPYVNRGISGQTTPQMLLRFQADVVRLHPAAVVILAGINDIAENTGPITDEAIEDNFRSMVAIAKFNHIRVILASTLPADHFPWRPSITPTDRVRTLNAWLADYANSQHLVFLNYYPALANPEGGMRPELATDKAVHPNDAGYALMQPLAEQAIAKSLATPAP